MLVKLALGAEMDVASSGELDTWGGKLTGLLDRPELPRPSFNTIVKADQFTSPSTRILDVGSPPAGKIWNVLGFVLAGNDDATVSSAGTVGFYIGALQATGSPSLADLRVPRLTIPTSQSFTRGTHWCGGSAHLLFNLVGLTGPTQLVANVFVAEWDEDAILQVNTR